ncbi:terpene synthase [Nocardia sp. NPDC052254]|uniref:terpene synthase family protein n=1 Tax=Nocardia sp. NPDC052254 TaxID=3155681 RepID=UPI0034325456
MTDLDSTQPADAGGPGARTPLGAFGGSAEARIWPLGLYAPAPVRDDERLGAEVDERLVEWCREVGIYTENLDYLRSCRFGRLVMLTCPFTDDPDRLLLIARWMVALFATDDYVADDERFGAVNELVAERLTFAMSVMDPPHHVGEYAGEIEAHLHDHPVFGALSSSLGHIARYATPSQLARIRHETLALFFTWTAEAMWRISGRTPALWEFLAERQHNSFLAAMSAIDVVYGYELPANVYSHPEVRRAVRLAADAATLVNDIYSVPKESETAIGDFNLPTIIAHERGCSLPEAIERSVAHDNTIVRAFETACRELEPGASPELKRFLNELWAWMGGNREWHSSSARYRVATDPEQA